MAEKSGQLQNRAKELHFMLCCLFVRFGCKLRNGFSDYQQYINLEISTTAFKAIFIDLDGTLLRRDHTISSATKDLIENLIAKKILVVLVSARPIHGITPISALLKTSALPVASLNGAYIVMGDMVIFQSSMDLEKVNSIHTFSKEFDVTLLYYTGLKWYSETNNAAVAKEQRITEVKVTVEQFPALLNAWKQETVGINKVMAIGKESVIKQFQSKLVSIFGNELNIYTSKPTYLEMMHANASKTNAMKFLLKRYDIAREEAIALGDNYNDKEMIMYAGTGVAMGNAPDEIKAVADYVTDTNQNDGVRKALEKFIRT